MGLTDWELCAYLLGPIYPGYLLVKVEGHTGGSVFQPYSPTNLPFFVDHANPIGGHQNFPFGYSVLPD